MASKGPNPDPPTNTVVKVTPNASLIDGLQAAGRLILFLSGVSVAVLGFVRAHDLAGLASYLQSNVGQIAAAVAGLIGLASAAYGVFKTQKRGAQLETAAADPRNKAVQFKQ